MNDYRWKRPRYFVGLAIIAFLVLIGISLATFWFFFPRMMPGDYYRYYPFFPFDFGWIWILLWILLIFAVMRWIFWPWGWASRRRLWRGDEAIYILKERYARGEITKEQFEQMMHDLEQHS